MKEQNQQVKFIPYPREKWSNYEEALAEILPYLFLSNKPYEICEKYAILKIMERITPAGDGGQELFLFFLIHDKSTEELEYMYSYPIETDLHIILHELIEAEIFYIL